MGTEIERKFLVVGDQWRKEGEATRYRQGFLSIDPDRTVRVRVSAAASARLTVKGRTHGATRDEYEYEIPVGDANEMLDRLALRPLIEKTRYRVEVSGLTWEVDVFHGVNEGLVLAEVELASEDEELALPEWCGEEVTGDARYYNASLVSRPYREW